MNNEPRWLRVAGSTGATGPLDWPTSAIRPRGRITFKPFSKVVRPTES